MNGIVIAGIGQTRVGEHWDVSLRELAYEAMNQALLDAHGLKPDALYVANMLAPVLSAQAHLGVLLADFAGLNGIEAATIESGGASGGAALRSGYMAVASGFVDAALVVGVEKFTDTIGSPVEDALMTSMDSDFEAPQGMSANSQAALIMQRYLYQYNLPHEVFAGFAVTAHQNGATNPYAMFQRAISLETYNRSGVVTEPLNMFDIAPYADGAAAVILTRSELLPPGYPNQLITITGTAMANDRLALHDRDSLTDLPAARVSIQKAMGQAGIYPGEVDFYELHDSYSIFSALSLEAAGAALPGEGWKLAQDGQINLKGSSPINTFGGLKARGNPGGAAGVYQAVEAVLQLRGDAGENQVPQAQRGLIQSLGSAGAVAAAHILERTGQ